MIVYTLKMCTSYLCTFHKYFVHFLEALNLNSFPFKMLRWCLVCVICNSNNFHSLNIQTLHNDCSYIEHVHLIFWAHFINIFFIFKAVEHCFHLKCLGGVCFVLSVAQVVFIPLYTYILCTFDYIFWSIELRHFYVYTTFGVLMMYNLCVICCSNRFHCFIYKLWIMIVHTLKICTCDAGPEQSLVLFLL